LANTCTVISSEVRIPVKLAQSYETIWIQVFQQFIGIYSKSDMTTGHKKC